LDRSICGSVLVRFSYQECRKVTTMLAGVAESTGKNLLQNVSQKGSFTTRTAFAAESDTRQNLTASFMHA